MSGLLIWIPEGADDFQELGLDWLEPIGQHSCSPSPGPGGERGRLIALNPSVPGGRRARCRYKPDEQRWTAAKYFCGYDLDDPPRPDDLQRGTLYFGHLAALGDEQLWLVPIVQPYGRHSFRVAPDGRTWLTTMPWDPELVAGCSRYWDWRFAAGEPVVKSDVVNLCVRALSVHYRLGPLECSALGLFDDRSIDRCLGAMLDVPAIDAELRARKKNDAVSDTAAVGSTSIAGAEDSNIAVQ